MNTQSLEKNKCLSCLRDRQEGTLHMYDSVTIVCGENTGAAEVVRACLESLRLRVNLYAGVWKEHLVDFFAGKVPCADYIVVCAGGEGDTESEEIDPGEMRLSFPCVENVDGRFQWESTRFVMTPVNIPELVHLPGKTLIWSGCGSGRKAFAEAFLNAGCRAYIGTMGETFVDAGNIFVYGFFYHLISADIDYGHSCTEQEAFV